MNYKEMYENAIKRAKAALEIAANKEEAEGYVSTIFPELKESEGEKIRKELIEHCKNQAKPYIDTGNECPQIQYWIDPQIQSWIDWLEKQGEQHCNVSPIDDFATEFEKQVSYIIASSINKENDYTADYVKWIANSLLNYARKEKHFNKGICPDCGKMLQYQGDVDGDQQWQCNNCKYTAYTGWFRK